MRYLKIVPRLLLMASVLFAVPALAQPSMTNSWATTASHPDWVSMCNVPDGTGTPFTAAHSFGCIPVDARIRVTMLNAAGAPMPGIPASDIWVESSLGGMALCPYTNPPGTWPGYVSIADGPTNGAGVTWFTNSTFAGGYTSIGGPEFCVVMTPWGRVAGTGPGGPPNSNLRIGFNSPDIDGNGVVDIADVAQFAVCFFGGGPPPYHCNFCWDNAIDLSDLVIMAQAYGRTCPP